jgi:SAM-dependent methyltransferase
MNEEQIKKAETPDLKNIKKDMVRLGYSTNNILNKYSKVGLWKSENYLISRFFEYNNNPANKMKVLDIGCGCGRTTIPLKQKGYNVTGIDISEHMVQRASLIAKSHRLNIDFRVMDACNMPLADESYDNALFSYNGIEHIPSIEQKLQVLSEVHRVLKPSGHFIFTVHSGIPNFQTFMPWLVRTLDTMFMFNMHKLPDSIDNLEMGEFYYNRYVPESIYAQIVPIFCWWKWIEQKGFQLVYTNTRERIDKLKPSSKISTIFYTFENFLVIKKIPYNNIT